MRTLVMIFVGIFLLPAALAHASGIQLTNLSGTPATIVPIAGTPQSAQIATAFALPLKVLVRDSSANPVPGITVTWTPPSSGASGAFQGGVNTAETDSSGVATSRIFVANLVAGSYAVSATVSGLISAAVFSLANIPAPPGNITPTAGTPQSAQVTTAFPTLFRVLVRDAANNPVPGVTVTWTTPATGPGGTFGGSGTTTAVTNSSGAAMSPVFVANGIAGSYVVPASVAGVLAPENFFLTNLPGPPAGIEPVAGTPETTLVNTPFPILFQVLVSDAFNNPVPGLIVRWTPPASGPGGAFEGGVETAVTGADGRATAARFRANGTAGAYVVRATITGVSAPALFNLVNIGILSVQDQPVPDHFALEQNFPNPFNPSTTITYSIARPGFVSLKIYDGLGREIASLVSTNVDAGRHEVRWDASGVGSGVYFCRLDAGGFRLTKRMVLVK